MSRFIRIAPFALVALLAGCAKSDGSARTTTKSTQERNESMRGAVSTNQTVPSSSERATQTPALPEAIKRSPIQFELASVGLPNVGMWKCDPAFGDVNHDGRLDLAAIPRLGHGPRVWLSSSSKNAWAEASEGLAFEMASCGGGVEFADVNGDGNPDLVVADHCSGIFVYLGDGSGHWTPAAKKVHPGNLQPGEKKYEQFVGAEDLAVGDIDSDGFLDIVSIAQDDGGLSVYKGDGTGPNWMWTRTELPSNGFGNRVMLIDVNRDGHLDIVASLGAGPRVFPGDGKGHWVPSWRGLPSPSFEGLYHGIAVGDVDEDGRLDLITANWIDGPEAYLQQTDGSWRKTADVFPEMRGGAVGLAVGDLDADGHLDIVVSGRLTNAGGYTRGVFALFGNGKGEWKFASDSGLPTTGLAAMSGVTIGDFDGDGIPDVAAGSGLIVETAPGPTEPSLAPKLLVWRGQHARIP